MAKRKKKPARAAKARRSRRRVQTTKGLAKHVKGDHVRVGDRTISLETSDRQPTASKGDGEESGLTGGMIEKAAVGLIDVAATLLKSGVQLGTRSTRSIKKQAESVVSETTSQISRTVVKGGKMIRKTIKKL